MLGILGARLEGLDRCSSSDFSWLLLGVAAIEVSTLVGGIECDRYVLGKL